MPHFPHPVDAVIFGNERHEYALQGRRREDYGHLSPEPLGLAVPTQAKKTAFAMRV
ncbi:hypothetical protein [Corynebacterium diphtheriae]|uniref:hypothetical protein n=1 Tax=Corynebacterium diphtheriae TaxID=1717 RepID=UPI0002DC8366|nr:hypothetical protein [Corynebacterium diphtheriae]